DDVEETRQENESLAPGEMGRAFFPFVNWVWFGAKALARTVWMPVGALSGVTYGIGRPAISVMTTPVVEAGAYDLLARGIAVPVALYAWNGITWVALAAGNVPTRESTFVRLVHREQEVVIERQQLETLLHAAVLKRLTDDRVAELNARIQEIEAEADAKKRPLREQQLA